MRDPRGPSLLVAFQGLDAFLRHRGDVFYRDWVLDSGAFSAFYAGQQVDRAHYEDRVRELLAGEDPPAVVFGLDVIGDHRQTLRNAEHHREVGIDAVPCYHGGEPVAQLDTLAKEFPRIALGGVARKPSKQKAAWARWCAARVWPKWMHGFGFGSPEVVLAAPLASVDASSWFVAPQRFGHYNMLDGDAKQVWLKTRARTGRRLKTQIEFFLDLERQASARWREAFRECGTNGCEVRLVVDSGGGGPGLEVEAWVPAQAGGQR